MMKKWLIVLAAALLAVSFTGCKSTLRENIEKNLEMETPVELPLDECFSEETGFQFYRVPWGSTGTDANKALYGGVTSVNAYGDDGSITYDVKQLNVNMHGRTVDAATLRLTKAEYVSMFTMVYSVEKLKDGMLSQNKLFDTYLETLTEAYGEPDDYLEETKEIQEGQKGKFRTYYWRYETADGRKTEVQWSSATVNNSPDANYVTLGFVWENAGEYAGK